MYEARQNKEKVSRVITPCRQKKISPVIMSNRQKNIVAIPKKNDVPHIMFRPANVKRDTIQCFSWGDFIGKIAIGTIPSIITWLCGFDNNYNFKIDNATNNLAGLSGTIDIINYVSKISTQIARMAKQTKKYYINNQRVTVDNATGTIEEHFLKSDVYDVNLVGKYQTNEKTDQRAITKDICDLLMPIFTIIGGSAGLTSAFSKDNKAAPIISSEGYIFGNTVTTFETLKNIVENFCKCGKTPVSSE